MAADAPVRYRRCEELVHRVLADRVVVRRIGDRSAHGAAELIGVAAIVFACCDQPVTAETITAETGLPLSDVGEAVTELIEGRWLIAAG